MAHSCEPSHGVFSVDLPCDAAASGNDDRFFLALSPEALQPFKFSAYAADDQHSPLHERDEIGAGSDAFDRLLAAQYEVMAFRAAEVRSCERSAVSWRCAELNGWLVKVHHCIRTLLSFSVHPFTILPQHYYERPFLSNRFPLCIRVRASIYGHWPLNQPIRTSYCRTWQPFGQSAERFSRCSSFIMR